MKSITIIVAVLGLSLPMSAALAGADIVFSADGKRLATAETAFNTGRGHVIRVIDTDTLEVQRRIWQARPIIQLCWARIGTHLVVAEAETNIDEHIAAYDTTTWAVDWRIQDRQVIAFSPRRDVMLTRHRKTPEAIEVRVTSTGKVQSTFNLPTDRKFLRGAVTSNGRRAIFHSATYRDATIEPKGTVKNPSSMGLKLADLIAYQQQDSILCDVVVIRLSDGKLLHREVSRYHGPSTGRMRAYAGGVLLFDNGARAMQIHPDGKTELLVLPSFMHWGIGFKADGSAMLLGHHFDPKMIGPTLAKPVKFDQDNRLVRGESYRALAFAPDGRVFGMTGAQRLLRFGTDRKLEKIAPVP